MDMHQVMKQAQKMQAELAKAQDALKDEEVEGSAGGGMVKVTITGGLEVKAVKIDPIAVDPDDIEMLEDMVTAAINEAIKTAQDLANERLGGITGGMNIPGLM